MTSWRDAIVGVDVCAYAALRAGRGVTIPTTHRRRCPVCRRRWYVTSAARERWEPLAEPAARHALREMAGRFVAQPADAPTPEERGFYAALAAAPELEADFACEVGAALVRDEPPPPPAAAPWRTRALSSGDPGAAESAPDRSTPGDREG